LDEIPISVLLGTLVILIIISGFFSGSETSLMTLNRYRLRHLVKSGNPGARRASKLLERPDRLIGLILLGNNFVNLLASAIATLIAIRLLGEAGILVETILLTIIVLIFAEVTPKTLAALHPERFAFPATLVLAPLLRILYPVVWIINFIASLLMRMMGVSQEDFSAHDLSREELRSVVNEAGAIIPSRHQKMLLNIFDLEDVTVDDIMVPRNEIVGIDLNDKWEDILEQLRNRQHTRLPVYRGHIDDVVGFIHLRNILNLMLQKEISQEELMNIVREPYFIPEGTPLMRQLLKFQRERRRMALVVDEYGDIQGLLSLEDILEEIVGEFTTDPASMVREIHPQDDGTWLVDGGVSIRDLNKALGMGLPTDGPKTLNGLIFEHLENIPEPGTSLLLAGHPVEVMQVQENQVRIAKIYPALAQDDENGKA
jgi:Mg2+/Co2+ transporter CorB